MKKIYLLLADGFEEIEGLTVVDLLRRAGQQIITVSIKTTKEIRGAHEIYVMADKVIDEVDFSDGDMLVLPGGGEGTENLESSAKVCQLIKEYDQAGKKVAAICAAPGILAREGLLKGKKATSYPSVMGELKDADTCTNTVVTDGNITTSRGLGTAIDFSLELIRLLCGTDKAQEIAESVVYIRQSAN